MPHIPQLLFAMYACARIGAIHVVVDDQIDPSELAKILDDCQSKLMCIGCGMFNLKNTVRHAEILDRAFRLC